MNDKLGISRRGLLKVAGASAGLAAVGALNVPQAQAHTVKWDKEYDVIIAGSGFAGSAAAIEAARAGAKVIVFEKMAAYGGNSAINGAAMAVAGSKFQKAAGIEDSVELMMKDMLASGRGTNHVDLLRVICEGTNAAYEMTVEFGVQWEQMVFPFGGHSIQRTLQTVNFTGGDIVVPLRHGAQKLGVTFQNRTKLEKIYTDESGAVTGVQVREGYRFPDETSGKLSNWKINRGFVAATGGYANDIPFRKLQVPNLDENVGCTNHKGATAESLQALLKIGAAPVNIASFQLGPWASPDEGGFGYGAQFNQQASLPYGIMVDVRDGKRFVNENADRKTRSDLMIARCTEADGTMHYPVAFCSEPAIAKSPTIQYALEEGVAWKFDSLEALAKHFNIPYEPLKAQTERFIQYAKNGKDEEFNKPIFANEQEIYLDKPPYYAMRAWPKVHFCQGGVAINTNAELLDMATNKPIPNAFAAGEITGGVHGESRLGSCSIAECLVMGRIAGQSAAKNKVS